MESKRVLVVAAHPDDEVLGCGGTMARHVSNGDEVHVMILAEGITSRDQSRARAQRKGELSELELDAKRANEILGVNSLYLHDFPDNMLDTISLLSVVKVVEDKIQSFCPDMVYTHFYGDLNIDHQIVSQAVTTACRPVPGQCVKTLLYFETASSTEWAMNNNGDTFFPNWYNDISDHLNKKLKSLAQYKSEMRPWPHARSVDALDVLAKHRGASVGVDAAEAFMLARLLG